MPEAPVDEDGDLGARKQQIYPPSGHARDSAVDPKPPPARVQKAPERHLRSGVTPSLPTHA